MYYVSPTDKRRTIPEEEQKRRQNWFDTAVKGLASQGFKRSLSKAYDDKTDRCAYRGSDGRKCAVGWIMDNELEALEGDRNMWSAFALPFLNGQKLSAEDRYFLSDLQDAHDAGGIPQLMKSRLVDVAEVYGLSIPEELK